jgi:hypothetical protein
MYDEKASKAKGCTEVYILYYKDKAYYSMWLMNPVKVEICREDKYIYINNLRVGNEDEKEFACEVFKFILQMKDLLEIEGYTMKEKTSSSEYYIELYGEYII